MIGASLVSANMTSLGAPAAAVHPLGTRAKVLLTGVFGPYACDDAYGSRASNPMEFYHNQATRAQESFSIRMSSRSWGLKLIQANISARCALLDFPSLNRFVKEISDNHYDIVGIGSILVNIGKVKQMCALVRKHLPAATIVVGGHIAGLPDLAARIDADHIVRGEGVRWFRSFLGEEANRPIRHFAARAASWLRVLGGDVPAARIPAILVPSVGCPMGCNFCATSAMFGGKGRNVEFYKTAEELFEVMCDIEKTLDTKDFRVLDENFLLRRDRALRLLALMEQHGKAWGLSVFSSVNAIRRYTFDELARLGVASLWLGLEGENSRYDKLARVDTRALVRALQSHGISVIGSTIIGLEEHTPENITAAIEYAAGHDADFHQFMLYTPLPGTPLFAELAAQGALLPPAEAPWADWHGQQRFVHRRADWAAGREKECLDQAFARDYAVNGPSVLRAIRTGLAGWKRYGCDPRQRIRERCARAAASLPTVQAGALWAGRRWFKDNEVVREKLHAVLTEIYAEFGVKARLAAPLLGRVILRRLRKEADFLARGGTYEPPTFYEKNFDDSAVEAEAGRCRPHCAGGKTAGPMVSSG